MKRPINRLQSVAALTGLLSLLACPVRAAEFSASGFGTVGYAVSDQSYQYQRFIDRSGTFKRDSVFGGQLDVQLNPEWSATVQAKVAPSLGNDTDWSLTASWAFVSWRPNNDWFLRFGKQRIPMYLNSENMDVGQTYDFARLPFEMYGNSPTHDLVGLYVSRNWVTRLGDLSLDMFAGTADLNERFWTRDLGAQFMAVRTNVGGGVLSLKMDSAMWRLGLYQAVTRRQDGAPLPVRYPYVSMGPGLGYYDLQSAQTTSSIANDIITVGMDMDVAPDWKVVAELTRNIQERTDIGVNSMGGYVAALHRMGAFTPYVSYARMRSMGAPVSTARALNGTQSPVFDGIDPRINVSQRAASDGILVYDQDTVALGMSYALSPQSKLKAEWANTRIGARSATVDSPPGPGHIGRERVQVLTLNYSFVF
jgi:hypothetical protein